MSVNSDNLHLTIRSLCNKTEVIEVNENTLVMDIGPCHGFQWPQYRLVLFDGKPLPIHQRIADCNIGPHEIIQVTISSATSSFYVELPDGSIKKTCRFKHNDVIFAVKRSLQLNPNEIDCYLNGAKLHNQQTIDECNIFRSCLVQCCHKNTNPSYVTQWSAWDKTHPDLSSTQHWIISNIDMAVKALHHKPQLNIPSNADSMDVDEKETQWKDVSNAWIPWMNIPKYKFNLNYPNDIPQWDRILQQRAFKINKLLIRLKRHKCEHRIHADGAVTFYPSPFLRKDDLGKDLLSTKSFVETKQYDNIMMQMQCDSNNLEALCDRHCQIIDSPNDLHAFIVAIEMAYFMHYPLKISPSHIWLLILQSVGMHLDQNAEKLRSKYVTHEGKQILTVRRPDFLKGNPNNKWDEAITECVQQMDHHTVNDTLQLLECDFSTTSPTEKIACKIAIMESMKHYFEYGLRGGCGFMQITLDGTKHDWVQLKHKVKTLLTDKVDKKFGATWGLALLPILNRFIDTYNGNIDCLFWNSMVRRGAISGSFGMCGLDNISKRGDVFYSGWFNVFFPLLNAHGMRGLRMERHDNRYCVPYTEQQQYVQLGLDGHGQGPKMELFASGLCAAPLIYTDLADNDKQYKMKLIAGFIGVEQSKDTLEIVPKIGWMVGNQKVCNDTGDHDALKCEQMYAAEYEWPCPLCSYLNAMTMSCAMCGCPKDAQ
eukprot:247514_1